MAALKPAAPADDYTKQFDVARSRASTAANADLQAKRDALARRAAQLGGGPSGAFIKAEQGAFDETQKNLGAANEQIDAAQQAEGRRIKEIQDAQRFQSSEREATQQFAAGQSAMDRRMAQQQFEANKALQEAGLTGKYGGQETMASRQYADTKAMANKEFEQNVLTNKVNTILSMYNSKIPPEQIGKLLQDLSVTLDGNGDPIVNLPKVAGLTSAHPAPMASGASTSTGYGALGPQGGRKDAYGNLYDSYGGYTDPNGVYHKPSTPYKAPQQKRTRG